MVSARSYKVLWVLTIGAFIVGGIGLIERFLRPGMSMNTGSYVSWGLFVSTYIYFIGLSAGAFLLSSLVYVFRIEKLERIGKFSLFTALVCLVMAMFSILFDLGHPFRALLRFLVSPNPSSMMGWMMFLYSAYFLLLLVELIIAFNPGFKLKKLGSKRLLFLVGSFGIPLAIAFHGGVGTIFAVVKAKPFWNTDLFPLMFILEALLSGGALITMLTFFFDPDRGSAEHKDLVKFLGRIVLGILALYILFYLSGILVAMYDKVPGHIESYRFIFSGQYAPFFWIGQVLIVVVIPLLLFTLKGKSALAATVASSLIVLGFVFVRLNIVVPAGIVPEFAGLRTAYIDPYLTYTYFPSLMEWLLELWILSVGMVIFLAGQKLLRLFNGG